MRRWVFRGSDGHANSNGIFQEFQATVDNEENFDKTAILYVNFLRQEEGESFLRKAYVTFMYNRPKGWLSDSRLRELLDEIAAIVRNGENDCFPLASEKLGYFYFNMFTREGNDRLEDFAHGTYEMATR
ncbi:MAG: hypothetical protein Q8M76_18975 [Spirochaetaceae bacterium]|nr:hypothetical protein [Spirochaetaceae bacterium]